MPSRPAARTVSFYGVPLFAALTTLLIASCSTPVTVISPREWGSDSLKTATIRTYAPSLMGRRIFLDPGHGGEDRQNRGPGGEGIEADINLRVGLALRDLLRQAGVTVMMSRETDTTVALRERVRMAVDGGADIFISLHHNATAQADNVTNYAAVYYHSHEGFNSYQPSNHDLARFIERDMSYAMRNPSAPSSSTFDGTLSDFDVYPNSGFAVLRDNPIPSVLIEASFFTFPPEERRLAMNEFNRVEAWGIFLGLGRYFSAGIPQVTLRTDTITTSAKPEIRFTFGPHSSVDPSTFQLYLDGRSVRGGILARDTSALWIPQTDLLSGNHTIAAVVRNAGGNSSWPYRRQFIVRLAATSLSATLHPTPVPTGFPLPIRIVCSGRDIQHRPLADGSTVHVSIVGTRYDTAIITHGGIAAAVIADQGLNDSLSLKVQSGSVSTMLSSRRMRLEGTAAAGTIRSTVRDSALGGASVRVWNNPQQWEPGTDSTFDDGKYVVCGKSVGPMVLSFTRTGYFPVMDTLTGLFNDLHHDVHLEPVAKGVLFGRTFVLDAESKNDSLPGMRSSAQTNLAVVRTLETLLRNAGANVILVREDSASIPEDERVRRSLTFPRGIYLRIDCAGQNRRADVEVYLNPANQILAYTMLGALHRWTQLDSGTTTGSSDKFYRNIPMTALTVRLPDASNAYFHGWTANAAMPLQAIPKPIDDLAWGLFAGLLAVSGGDSTEIELPCLSSQFEGYLNGLFKRVTNEPGRFTVLKLSSSALQIRPERIP